MGRLPERAQLLALALLNHADDLGYFHADPAIVRGACAPFREDLATIREDLARLSEVEWVALRDHPTQGQIGYVVNWAKHQKVDHPKASKIEGYFIREILAKPREKLALYQGTGNRDQGNEGAPEAKEEKVKEENKRHFSFNEKSEEPKPDPSEQDVFVTPKNKPLPAKLGPLELQAIPGLKRIPKDMPALIELMNIVGADILRKATQECVESGREAYESNVSPIAIQMKHHQDNPPGPPRTKPQALPEKLSDLPDGHPAKPKKSIDHE